MKTNQVIKPIHEGWTLVDESQKIEDLESYIFNQMATKQGTIVSIGTDADLRSIVDFDKSTTSKRYDEKKLRFLTVIVFRTIGIPCINHIILRRDEERKFGKVPTAVKLNGEINRTSELALYFRDKIGFDPEVHLDVNPRKTSGSFEVYNYIRGYFESLGFKKVEYKPAGEAYSASAVADYFL